VYNTDGDIIGEHTAFSRPLYEEDMQTLPTWKVATNDQGRYDTTIGRDDYSPHTGDSVNLRGGVNRSDMMLIPENGTEPPPSIKINNRCIINYQMITDPILDCQSAWKYITIEDYLSLVSSIVRLRQFLANKARELCH
jgi:hypothetical protein